ncbi:hypothetical protein C5S36_13610 [Candidatus Methanophagaceae archaeon]|nr:hypothetical protein C5S36_13610 [Methanophagales archaeon]
MQYFLITRQIRIKGKKAEMKIVTIIVLIVVALVLLLPILAGRAPIPENVTAQEIGEFGGGFMGYWIDALKTTFSSL